MEQVMIRPMTIEDTKSFRTMHAKSWREYYANESEGVSQQWVNEETTQWLTPEKIAESKEFFEKVLNDSEHQLLKVAVDIDNEVVGFIHVKKEEARNVLDGLYVDSLYHGSGLAQKLVAETFPWLDKSKPIWLEVVRYNSRAIRFYEKLGFHLIEGSDHVYKNLVPIVEMEKSIE